jgi:hypothetical protein
MEYRVRTTKVQEFIEITSFIQEEEASLFGSSCTILS